MPELREHTDAYERLYGSLIALRSAEGPRIPTMGDAAASKILHLMVPGLFVMWDKAHQATAAVRGLHGRDARVRTETS